MDLYGKVAWITGGARMGLAVGRVLSSEGCRLVYTYRRSRKSAEETRAAIASEGGDAMTLHCDLTQQKEIERAALRIAKHYGQLDILVNLASIYEKDAWNEHMKANAESAYLLSLATAPWMMRAGAGRMVHMADWTSASGRPRYKGLGPYYVSKRAIQGVVEAMALELAPQILVNAIAPGPMLAPKGMSKSEYKAVIEATPLARWGGAEEIAKAVRFLCQTDFMTGETIRVDGGRHLY